MPDPAKVLADFKPEGGPRVIAARVHGVLKSAFSGPPPLAKEQKRPDNFPDHKAQTDGAGQSWWWWPTATSWPTGSGCAMSDFFGQQTATPFSDNGPFVANLIGTLAGGDALIGLRSRGDTNRPFTLVNEMQSEAEAKFRQTQQALQKHLDDAEKQLRTLRQGPGGEGSEPANAQAVITPDQRAAIDAARHDMLKTRQKLRAVQLELNRDISRLETEMRMFTIVLVPALLTMLAITLGDRATPPAREGHAHETAHAACARRRWGSSQSPAAGISARPTKPGGNRHTMRGGADVSRPGVAVAGCRADRDHPSGQDDGASRSVATRWGLVASLHDYAVQEAQAARHADGADRIAAGRAAHHRPRRSSAGSAWTTRTARMRHRRSAAGAGCSG